MKKVGVASTPNFSAARFCTGLHSVQKCLIRQAGLELVLAETGLLRPVCSSAVLGSLTKAQFGCWSNSRSTIGKIAVVGTQRASMKADGRQRIEREFAEDVIDLAGVDVFRLELPDRCRVCQRWQCGQVIEAYSMTTLGALGSPRAMSPRGPATIRSALRTGVVACVRSFRTPGWRRCSPTG